MRSLIIGALLAVAQARFGQEQVPIPAIAAVQGGSPGVAQTIAGAAVSDLLAGANACAKLQRADQIITELGTGADAVAAAIGMVTAEKNFNPFTQSIPTICSDPTLPATQMLRGITTKVDPAVGGADVANALAISTATTPLDATGQSVADLMASNGFTNFTTQDASGSAGVAGATSDATTASTTVATAPAATTLAVAPTDQCSAQVAAALASASAAMGTSTAVSNATAVSASSATDVATSSTASSTGTDAAGQTTSIAGDDFGTCNPSIKFEGGLGGRPANEFTFQSQDPAIIAVQEEALNPNIITNRICDSLTNFCGANAAAKATCASAQAQISALGTKDITTAQTWNQLVGFAGVSTNPDGGAAEPAATQAVAGRRLRRNWSA